MTPSSGSINLLSWLTELRKTVDLPFIIKGYDKDTGKQTSRWKRWVGQARWKGAGSSHTSADMPLSLHLHVFAHLQAFHTPDF